MTRSTSSGGLLKSLAILYIVLWTIAPQLSIDVKWRLLALGAAGIWFLLSPGSFQSDNSTSIAIFFALEVALVALVEGGFSSVLKQISLYLIAVFFLMFKYYKDRNTFYEIRWIFPIVLLALSLFNHRSAQALHSNPAIARMLVHNDESIFNYLRQGIGGYGLLYSQVVIFPAILYWIEIALKQSKIRFIIGCVWLVTYVRFIMAAGYSIAIFSTFLGIFLLHFYKGRNVWQILAVSIALMIIVTLSIVYLTGFRRFLLNLFDGTKVAKKINEIVYAVETGTDSASIAGRMVKYMASVQTILRFPIIGGLFWQSGGGHSGILDAFAKYGVFGGYAFVKLLFSVPNYYRKNYYGLRVSRVFTATMASMLIVTLFNSCPYNLVGMMLLVLPILFDHILVWSGVKE